MAAYILFAALVLNQGILVSSAATLTANATQIAWENYTLAPASSYFESGNVQNDPVGAPSTYDTPGLPVSRSRLVSKTAGSYDLPCVTDLPHPSIQPVDYNSTSTLVSLGHTVWKADIENVARYMGNIAVAFEGIIFAQPSKHERLNTTSTQSGSATSTSSHNDAMHSHPNVSAHVRMAAFDIPNGSIVFLNTTSPNYVLIDYANASVMIWTEPANTSTVREGHLGKIVTKINAWLPYIEVLGILGVVCKVGELIYKGVKKFRNRGVRPERSGTPR